VQEPVGTSTWSVLGTLAPLVGRVGWVRGVVIGSVALTAVTTVGIARRRGWGFVLALPISAAILACTLVARYVAVFEEPRQFVARSHYVHAATVVAVISLASHGVALLLAARLARRPGVPVALVRLVGGAVAVLIAAVPVIWVHDRLPGGPRNAMLVGACAVTTLAALIACAAPRRATVRAALAIAGLALATFAVGVALHLGDRPRRGATYSWAAERAIAEVAFAAPFVLALIALLLVLGRHVAARRADATP